MRPLYLLLATVLLSFSFSLVILDSGEESSEELSDENDERQGPLTEEDQEKEKEAEENPDLFEGDLKLDKQQLDEINQSAVLRRDAISEVAQLWPKGRVPYVFHSSFDRGRRNLVRQAITEFRKKTCVRFRKRKKQKNFVQFIKGKGCYATSIGRSMQGKVTISIGDNCDYIGVIIHEMMHVLGFFHEQSRLDRDNFVTIFWKNIKKDRRNQFKKYPHGKADYVGESYDYDSVMHYPSGAFSSDRSLLTIVRKDRPGGGGIGQRKGFSTIDLRQINKLYKCKKFIATEPEAA